MTRHRQNACLALAVLVGACSSGRASVDASATGSAGTGGGAGGSGGGLDGGAGGTGIAGMGGRGGAGGAGTGGDGGTGGGGGTVAGDAGATACGNACTADQVCVRNVIGGASYVCPDAGHVTFPPNCDGLIVDSNGCCFGSEVSIYGCGARPSGCGATVTCACAASTLCPNGSCSESGANEIVCLTAGP